MKYPMQLVDSTVKTFLNLTVADQSSLQFKSTTENITRVVIPLRANVSKGRESPDRTRKSNSNLFY